MTNKTKSVVKKTFKIVGDILIAFVLLVTIFVLGVTVTSKKDSDGTATIFGTQLRFVQSDSMAKCEYTDVSEYDIKSIPVKSCVFIETIPTDEKERDEWYANLRVGDVLTFKYVYTKQETITHRIIDKQYVEIKDENDIITGHYYIFTLMGDNKNSDSSLLTQTINTMIDGPNYIIGKVVGQSYVLGLMVYAFKSPVGIVCLIIIPCLIIIAFEIMKIVKVLGKDKKTIQQKQADEIEELKRQLAMLQESVEKKEEQ